MAQNEKGCHAQPNRGLRSNAHGDGSVGDNAHVELVSWHAWKFGTELLDARQQVLRGEFSGLDEK